MKNDRRSQNALYKNYFPLMSSIALRYAQNEDRALHLLNGGFLKVLLNISSYNDDYSLATWIRNVLVNHIIDEFRKEKKHISKINITDFEDNLELISFNMGEAHLEAEELRAMLNQLPDVTKEVFNLFAIDGFKHKEISDMLGISAGTSKWHVSEARTRLKKMIEKRVERESKLLSNGL